MYTQVYLATTAGDKKWREIRETQVLKNPDATQY